MIKLSRLWRPRGRAGGIALVAVLIGGGLAASIGAGYTVARPLLGSGAETLPNGHGCAHVNGETGKADANCPDEYATGKQKLLLTTLPDGRSAVVNVDTGMITYLDNNTLGQVGPSLNRPESKGQLQPLPTQPPQIVDYQRDVVEQIDKDGNPATPVPVPGILAAVPVADSVWAVTDSGEVVEIARGRQQRRFKLTNGLRITVADNHPVVVDGAGVAYAVDGLQPTSIGHINLPANAVLGSWQGSGRFLVGVDRSTNRVVALDPRTKDPFDVELPVPRDIRPALQAPVQLGDRVYVPDESGPAVWRADLRTKRAERIEVPGQPGPVDIKVSSDKVWVSTQYDQRGIVIDAMGAPKTIDKGPAPGTEDSSRKENPDPNPDPSKPTEQPKPTEPAPGPPPEATPQPAKQVVVPTFRAGTKYQQACATLRSLELACEAVAAGDAPGRGPDEVIDTNPRAGSRLPAGARVLVHYAGPVAVPNVVDLGHQAACEKITAAGLTCREEVAPDLAANPATLLKVTTQDPLPGREIDKGSPVRITYRDSIALASFTGTLHGQACDQIDNAYHMKCQATAATGPAEQCRQTGTVFQQNPPAGSTAKAGSAVSLTYCGGNVIVPNYAGMNIDAACQKAQSTDGLRCTRQEIPCGTQPGIVRRQTPPAGVQHDPRSPVTLEYDVDTGCEVLNYVGQTPDNACADITARGFQCARAEQLYRSPNIVEEQNPPPGTARRGATITIRYSRWVPVEYRIYRQELGPGNGLAWILTWQGVPPGNENYHVGWGYPPDEDIPNPLRFFEFTCVAASECIPGNRFYSRVEQLPGWSKHPNSVGTFMTCTDGTIPVYRLWRGQPPRREYGISNGIDPAWAGNEPLGCVWP